MKIEYLDRDGRDRSSLLTAFVELHRWVPGRVYEAVSYRLATLLIRGVGVRVTLGRWISMNGKGVLRACGQLNMGRHVIFQVDAPYRVSLGDGVTLDDGVSITARYGDLTIGGGSYIGKLCYFDARGPIVLGERVDMAAGVKLFSFMHSVDRTVPRRPDTALGITIGDDVWIGANVVILDGVALRIATNLEYSQIRKSIPKLIQSIRPGGRLVVITFHSAEDRIVKYLLKDLSEFGVPVNKKVIIPTDQEEKENPRSRSAKLRVFERSRLKS